MKKRRKTEYSKIILMVLMGIQIFITLSAIILMFYVKTTEGLEYLIPSISAELSIAVGFYYNKAKRENELKIRKACKEYNIEWSEEDEQQSL